MQRRRTTKRPVMRASATRGGVVLAAAALLGLCPTAALADEDGAPAVDTALELANQRYVQGDFAGALEVLSPACEGSARPECAFSLGAVYHALGQCADARREYLRYRELAPSGGSLPDVSAALAEVESRCGSSESTSTAPASRTPAAIPSAMSPSGMSPSAAAAAAPMSSSAAGSASASSLPPLAPLPSPGEAAAPPVGAESAESPALALGSGARSESGGSGNTPLIATFLGLSGAAVVTSVVFGVLAAKSADRCSEPRTYNQHYIDECEGTLPRYRALWQGFAVAGGSFLAIGGALWWVDLESDSPDAEARAPLPMLKYRQVF